ncbi:UDP-glucose dehydrogenase family protein, partial [Actinoplanes sp. NPDC051494]|uniref:UDP-glucose dehydrogenase family protein n=1 Tax=Actinoplanes sp. NPDC051494 TaxID=3363907 RepID=UPI0037AE717C
LGATYAICFAELGYDVLGFDIDAAKIGKLAAGQVPFHEPGLDDLLRTNLASGRLRFTTSYEEVADHADIHFICVGTPQRTDGPGADLTYVETSVTNLAKHLKRRALIVGKSTVPVGTAEWIEQLLAKQTDPALGIEVAWSPEFLQEGFAVEDVLRPNRIVVGVKTDWANAMLYAAHKGVFDLAASEEREVPLVVTDFATAELVKVAANAFLATKISFINAMAEVCEVAGGDITQLAKAIGYDPRIGNKFLQAGIGFGGGCLPKDIRAFQTRAQELGAGEALRFLHEVDLINLRRRSRVIQLAAELLHRRPGPAGPDLSGTRIAVLGAAFKPNSDDVRDAPALSIAASLA